MRYVATTGAHLGDARAWYVADYGPNGDTVPSIEVPGTRRKHRAEAVRVATHMNREWEATLRKAKT